MMARMKSMHPRIEENWNIVVPVENEMVEDGMRHLLPQLTSYLRTQLFNDQLTITIKLAEGKEQRRILSRLERFQDMLQRNRGLQMLKDALHLELS